MDPITIGKMLKTARNKKRFKTKTVAGKLKVKEAVIEDLEAGKFAELSEKIYLTGCVKLYADLLGLDGGDIVKKLKSHSKEFDKVKELTTETSAFSYAEQQELHPNRRIIFISLCMTLLVYFFWSKTRQMDLAYVKSDFYSFRHDVGISSLQNLQDNIQELTIETNNATLVFLAKSSGWLKVTNEEGKTSFYKLAEGEAEFVIEKGDILVSAENPAGIEVYREGKENTFLGTIANMIDN